MDVLKLLLCVVCFFST